MPINWGQVAATTVVTTIVGSRVRDAISDTGSDGTAENGDSGSSGGDAVTDGGDVPDHHHGIDELVHIERTNNAPPEALDAFVGETVDIPAGGSATIEVTPSNGYNMRVESMAYDRRTDHTYRHVVGGIPVGESHRANFSRPRKVTQGGGVVAVANNNSGSESTQDFELVGWSIPSEAGVN